MNYDSYISYRHPAVKVLDTPCIQNHVWNKMQAMGFYVTQRGEGKFWILHNPKGQWVKTAANRAELLSNLDRIFN